MKLEKRLFLVPLVIPFLPFPQDEAPLRPAPTLEEEWRTSLTDPDLDRREEGLDRIVSQAKSDPGLMTWLEEATRAEDSVLAWSARVALRDLRRAQVPGQRLGRGGDIWDDWFGGRLFDAWGRPRGVDPFQALEQLRQLGDGLGKAPLGIQSKSESYRLESGPDGVRIEIAEKVGGDEKTKVYEGDSLEELLQQHPELRDKVGVGALPGDSGWLFGRVGRIDDLERMLERVDPTAPPMARGLEPRLDRLGVYVRPPSDEERELDALETEGGLVVERVLPGSLAAMLGVEVGDLILELNGRTVSSAVDIATALTQRGAHEEIVLVLLDSQGRRQERRWSPVM